jgi:hypothetical protein
MKHMSPFRKTTPFVLHTMLQYRARCPQASTRCRLPTCCCCCHLLAGSPHPTARHRHTQSVCLPLLLAGLSCPVLSLLCIPHHYCTCRPTPGVNMYRSPGTVRRGPSGCWLAAHVWAAQGAAAAEGGACRIGGGLGHPNTPTPNTQDRTPPEGSIPSACCPTF